ncbi:MAG TPA: M1 family aminopeptidase [Polyangiaceae bacterium]|jgi:hypothetical protein
MKARSLALLSLAGALAGAAGFALHTALAAPSSPAPWYDATPLLSSLRPAARSGLPAALGVSSLEDLPLYDLDLRYDPAAAPSFALTEDVWFTNTTGAPLPDLVFRIYANAAPPPTGPLVRFLSGACEGAPCTITSPNPGALHVQPSAPLAPGGRLRLTFRFAGTLTRIDSSRTNVMAQGLEGLAQMLGGEGGGAAGGDYGILGVGDGIVSFGNFYAVLARRAGGVWETDEASKLGDLGSDRMANVRAKIDLPARAKLAVSGTVASEAPVPGAPERRQVRVVAAAIRDFALLFGEGMESSSRDVHGTQVRSFYNAADRTAGLKVLDAAAHALEDFERRFGNYPYADFEVSEAAIVGGAGGVEFSGLVTAASMFYRPGNAAPAPPKHASKPAKPTGDPDDLGSLLSQLGGGNLGDLGGLLGGLGAGGVPEGMLEFVVAHETAHQWWHGLVGSDSRDHPYVDEALAQYSALVYLEDRYGAARADQDGALNAKMNYQSMRMLGQADGPVDRPVASFPSSVAYAGLVYGKAPYFYKAARAAVGDAVFFSALRSYVAQYRFREAPGRGPADSLARFGGEGKVRPIEHHWLDETHGDADLGTLDLGGLGGLLGGAGGGDLNSLLPLLGGGGDAGVGGLEGLDDLMKALGP